MAGSCIRRRYFIDKKVQGALLIRTVWYWGFCLLTIGIMLAIWRSFTGPAQVFYDHFHDIYYRYGPALIASILLLPIVVLDVIRLSNRFAGPVYRLRDVLQRVARGEKVEPIQFRDDDFWKEIADDFNAIVDRLNDPRKDLFAGGSAEKCDKNSADEETQLAN